MSSTCSESKFHRGYESASRKIETYEGCPSDAAAVEEGFRLGHVDGPHLAGLVLRTEEERGGCLRQGRADAVVGAVAAEAALHVVLEFRGNLAVRLLGTRAHGPHDRPAAQAGRVRFQDFNQVTEN